MSSFDDILQLLGRGGQPGQPQMQAPPVVPMAQPPQNAMAPNAFDNMMGMAKGKESHGALSSILKLFMGG